MTAAALELPLLERPTTAPKRAATALNTLIKQSRPVWWVSEHAVSQFLEEPVEPIICWLDSGCPRRKQLRSVRWTNSMLLMVACIVLVAGVVLTVENTAAQGDMASPASGQRAVGAS